MNNEYVRIEKTYTAHKKGFYYYHYLTSTPTSLNRVLLLHGSRLGAIETWEPVIRYLCPTGWLEIAAPDLPGVGALNPVNQTDNDFDLDCILKSIIRIVDELNWPTFSLVGYSYGGFLAHKLAQYYPERIQTQFIIESAFLAQTPEHLPEVGYRLNELAEMMKSDPAAGNQAFSELISKKNTRKFAIARNTRPIYNPLGFANLMKIMTACYFSGEIWQMLDAQTSPITVLLADPIGEGKKNLFTLIGARYSWKMLTLPRTDHSLVFTHPQDVANLMSEWLKE